MSETPAPPEVVKEASRLASKEKDSQRNFDIQRTFTDFKNSPEYKQAFEERKAEIHRDRPQVSEEVLKAGFEGRKAPGEEGYLRGSEAYKDALMKYTERFHDETGKWPLYFSVEHSSPQVSSLYQEYSDQARLIYRSMGKVDLIKFAELDKERSNRHDRLALQLYREGKVGSEIDGRLVARLWLVGDGIEGPGGIATMDKARTYRDTQHMFNLLGHDRIPDPERVEHEKEMERRSRGAD